MNMDTDFYKGKLEQKRTKLMRRLNGRSLGMDVGGDSSDIAQKIISQDHNVNMCSSLDSQLRAVKDALERIEEGNYGDCLYCGEEIAEKRLEAIPEAEYCVDCKGKYDGSGGEGKREVNFPDDSVTNEVNIKQEMYNAGLVGRLS